MELSQRFLDTLTAEQKALLDEEQAQDSKTALDAYLREQAEKDKAEEAFAEALKSHLR